MSGGGAFTKCAYTSHHHTACQANIKWYCLCERQPLSVRSVCNVFIFECSYKLDCQSQWRCLRLACQCNQMSKIAFTHKRIDIHQASIGKLWFMYVCVCVSGCAHTKECYRGRTIARPLHSNDSAYWMQVSGESLRSLRVEKFAIVIN